MTTPSQGKNQYAQEFALPGVLVSHTWLSAHVYDANLRILDARAPQHYAAGHIPGALNVPLESCTCTLDGVPGMLLPADAYASLMSRLGISDQTAVVVYDDTWGMAAARLYWSLENYGHRSVAVLNGGWGVWRANGLAADSRIPDVPPGAFVARHDNRLLATYAWLTERIDGDLSGAQDLLLVDTRSPSEYDRGHLPSAVNWDWTNATSPTSWEALRDEKELRAELHQAGITPDKEIVVYCRSGVRAAHTYLVLRHLGYPRVRNYDGSWLEWELRAPYA